MSFEQSLNSNRALSRRHALTLLAAGAWPPRSWADDKAPTALLRAGGCVVLLRHATTVPGIGDPPEFRLDDCRTQRNLSEAGQQEAKRIGAWFRSRELKPRKVLSSAWCRCQDTADLAFGQHEIWSALNSTFGDRHPQPEQSEPLRQALSQVPTHQFDVWVTHQVNISSLTGQTAAMGEGIVVDRQAQLLARTIFR